MYEILKTIQQTGELILNYWSELLKMEALRIELI